jgi:cytochrome P450
MSGPFAQLQSDPYPFFASLRGAPRALPFGPLQAWLLTRYEDVLAAFKDPETFSSLAFRDTRPELALPGVPAEKLAEMRAVMLPDVPTVLNTDPPEHGRYRGLLNRGFTPREIGRIEPRIREITAELVDAILARGRTTDLVRELTVPLPVTVIAELLGVDRARHADFKRWSDAFVSAGTPRGLSLDTTLPAMREFNEYFSAEIERRRASPGDDLISLLVQAETSEGRLSPLELLAFTRLLLVAGNETTTNLIGNAVIALLDHPEQLERLRAEPARIPDAVEEALRYDAPVQGLPRLVREDVELGGVKLPAGARAFLMIGAANRDPERWPEPDRFDVARDTTGHLGFGFGIHFCLGSHLARLESRCALEAIVQRLGDLELAGPIERTINPILRGPAKLPLAFSPRA